MKFSLIILLGAFLCAKSQYTEVSWHRSKSYAKNSVPTRLAHYRRSLEPIDDAVSSTPLDLFFARDPERRSLIESIWNWDWWCQLQPNTGHSRSSSVRYYYESQLDQCFAFSYDGQAGNKNNFKSLVECERHCKGTAYMTLRETSKVSYCGLQPNAGMCLALNYRYYYDVSAGSCKMFVYGGCGGNQNRFATEEECVAQCHNRHYDK